MTVSTSPGSRFFRDVKVPEVTAEPGNTMFLSLGWWRQVTALDTRLSSSNLAVPHHYSYLNPEICNW